MRNHFISILRLILMMPLRCFKEKGEQMGKWMIIGILGSMIIVGCKDKCQVEDMRCADSQIEICDGDGKWQGWTDCADIYPGRWTCCEVGEDDAGVRTAECLIPADVCEADRQER